MVLLHSHIARSFGNQTVWLTQIFVFEVFFGICAYVCVLCLTTPLSYL